MAAVPFFHCLPDAKFVASIALTEDGRRIKLRLDPDLETLSTVEARQLAKLLNLTAQAAEDLVKTAGSARAAPPSAKA